MEEKNLVFIPFAFDVSKQTGANVRNKDVFSVYCKNLCVALISIKKYNTKCDIALVTNIELPNVYKKTLENNGILIYNEEFDSFIFPNEYKWALAFYKLCALKKMIEEYNYSNYLYLDADVIIQQSLDNIWIECKKNILLYDINHGLNFDNYRKFLSEVLNFTKRNDYITQYGGEFFAASKENAQLFINICAEIYEEMKKNKFETSKGDEFIVSIAASKLRDSVKNAGAYIFRFWTDSFYLVSTCYKYNEVCILHMPAEKNNGMIKIYNKYIRRNKFPRKEKIYKICHLYKKPFKAKIKSFIKLRLRKY